MENTKEEVKEEYKTLEQRQVDAIEKIAKELHRLNLNIERYVRVRH